MLSYAGEDCPKTVFPTAFATTPSVATTATTTGAAEDPRLPTYYHGQHLHLYRPHAVHSNFISDGLITDWDALERNLDYAFRDRMRLPTLTDYPLLVTEPSWNTKENREKMCEIAFEKWDVPAYYAVDKAVMSAFAASRGSALVLDIGDEMTSLVPIYDGFVLRKGPSSLAVITDVVADIIRTLSYSKTADGRTSAFLDSPPAPQSAVSAHPDRPALPRQVEAARRAPHPCSSPITVRRFVSILRTSTTADPYDCRTERMPDEHAMDCPTTPSYHHAQEMRVMHEFKESTCEVLPSFWDDQSVVSLSYHLAVIYILIATTEWYKIDRHDLSSFRMATTRTLAPCERRRRRSSSTLSDSFRPR